MFNKTIVGTCSLCGGCVSLPSVFWSVIPPTPTCEGCGATAKSDHGPIIPMSPPTTRTRIRISDNTSECNVR